MRLFCLLLILTLILLNITSIYCQNLEIHTYIPYNSKSSVIGLQISNIPIEVGYVPEFRLDIEELAVETHPTRYGSLSLETFTQTLRYYAYGEELFRYDKFDEYVEFVKPSSNDEYITNFGAQAMIPVKQFMLGGEFYATINITDELGINSNYTAITQCSPWPAYSDAMAGQIDDGHNDTSRTFYLDVQGANFNTSKLRLDVYAADESISWGRLNHNKPIGMCSFGSLLRVKPNIFTSKMIIFDFGNNTLPQGITYRLTCDNVGLISRDDQTTFSSMTFVLGNGTSTIESTHVVNAFIVAEGTLSHYEYYALLLFGIVVLILFLYFVIKWALRAWNRYKNGGDPYIALRPEIAALQETVGRNSNSINDDYYHSIDDDSLNLYPMTITQSPTLQQQQQQQPISYSITQNIDGNNNHGVDQHHDLSHGNNNTIPDDENQLYQAPDYPVSTQK